LGISFNLRARLGERDWMTYFLEIARLGAGSSYRIQRELFADYEAVANGNQAEPLKFLERTELQARIFAEKRQVLTAPEESVSEDEAFLAVASGPFVSHLLLKMLQQHLANWTCRSTTSIARSVEIIKARTISSGSFRWGIAFFAAVNYFSQSCAATNCN
jgi:hypothetical protein